MRHARWMFLLLAAGLLLVAVGCLVLVGDRLIAAIHEAWKFEGHGGSKGIDIGMNAAFRFLSCCVLGQGTSFLLVMLAKRWGDALMSRMALAAGLIYLLSGAVLFFLVSSGAAFLYGGR